MYCSAAWSLVDVFRSHFLSEDITNIQAVLSLDQVPAYYVCAEDIQAREFKTMAAIGGAFLLPALLSLLWVVSLLREDHELSCS